MGCSLLKCSTSSYSSLPPKLPNPDPKNFKVVAGWKNGKYLLLEVCYPDCKNFEGRKLLLYHEVTAEELAKQKSLDPHFSDNKYFHSPIARFEPTEKGLKMAFVIMEIEKKENEINKI